MDVRTLMVSLIPVGQGGRRMLGISSCGAFVIQLAKRAFSHRLDLFLSTCMTLYHRLLCFIHPFSSSRLSCLSPTTSPCPTDLQLGIPPPLPGTK